MATQVDRQQLADMLERLRAEDDGEALAAARQAQGVLDAAGATWHDVLLAPPAAEDAEEEEEELLDDVDEDMEEDDDTDGGAMTAANEEKGGAKGNEEALRLIERMLAQAKDDADFREELNGYKEDIEAGEFTDRDRRYVKDLYDRLRGT